MHATYSSSIIREICVQEPKGKPSAQTKEDQLCLGVKAQRWTFSHHNILTEASPPAMFKVGLQAKYKRARIAPRHFHVAIRDTAGCIAYADCTAR